MTSVTQCLSLVQNFDGIPAIVLKKASQLGTQVHAYALAFAKGYHLEPSDDEIHGYLTKFKEWFINHVVEVIDCEIEVSYPSLGYIGHIDMIARLKGDKTASIIDLKRTAMVQASTALQLAAYQEAATRQLRRTFKRRGALHIPVDGPCRFVEFSNPLDFTAFVNLLSVYNHLRKGE